MKKILILSVLTTMLVASQADLIKRIDLLEREIAELKKLALQNSDDVAEVMPILEKVEKKTILDKLNFSPELELRTDKLDYTNNKIDGEDTKIQSGSLAGQQRRDDYSKYFNPAASVRFRLNMSAELDDKVKFNGRMLFMYSTQSYQRLCILSRDIKTVTSSSAFDVDRAYFDYSPNKNSKNAFTFSFGLLPTTGGTPMQYGQSTTRKSMFPSLVFDMNTFGLIATQKLADDSFLRAIIAKAYTLRPNFYPYQCNRENIDNANVVGLYYDAKYNFLGKSLLSFGVNMLHDLRAHPYLGPDVTADNANILGNILTYGVGIDIEKFAKTDATVFLHTALSNPHGNGKTDDYQIDPSNPSSETTVDGNVGFSTASYAKGEMLKDNGYAIYLGTKYDISNSLSLGAEYNYGSKYWFSATQGEDMYNKLATRGHVGEAYITWQFYKHLYAKFGYLYTKEQYTGSGWHFGEPAKKDATQSVGYLSITAKY